MILPNQPTKVENYIAQEEKKDTQRDSKQANKPVQWTDRVEGTEQLMSQSLHLSPWPFTKISNTNVADFMREKALGASKNFTVTSEPWQRAPKHKTEKTQQIQNKSGTLSWPISEKYDVYCLRRAAMNQGWHLELWLKRLSFQRIACSLQDKHSHRLIERKTELFNEKWTETKTVKEAA